LADLTPLLPSFNPLIGWGLIPILGLSPWLLAVLVPLVGLFVVVPLVFVVGIWLAPVRFVYAFFWLFFHVFYRIKVHGAEHIPASGPVLITPNHVSWLDGFLIQYLTERHLCTLVYAGNFEPAWIKRLGNIWKAILISPGPKSIVKALKTARQYLLDGEVVCIFPEGGISRNGQLQAFRPGMMKILQGTDACVVPVYFDGLWGSVFSFSGGTFFWKIPQLGRRKIDVYFGEPIYGLKAPHQARSAVEDLGAIAVQNKKRKFRTVSDALIRACKKRKTVAKLADSMGTQVTGGEALMRGLILRRLLKKHVLDADEQHVGILLPPLVGGVLTNMAIILDKRIPINLNYTVSSSVMNECIKVAGIRHVLTSRKVMEKFDFDLDCEVVYLEDYKEKVSLMDKIAGVIGSYLMPAGMLSSMLGLNAIDREDVLTVIFTSGSTGTPKGVMLTYSNVSSNIDAIEQVIRLDPSDVIIGILPFFHSMGFTVTMCCVMALDIKGIYHTNPLESRQVGKLTQKHGGTILVSTPTFLRSYLRRVSKEEFATVDTVVAGAEKLPRELCDAFEEKFGVRPVEGYGTTELSPLVSVNVPPSRDGDSHQMTLCEGSVGRCIPGVSARIVDVDTNEEADVDQPGMLWIKGPKVMKGYLNNPEKTAEVLQDGWYNTGDIAKVDKEGFIHITGRVSRFSKIGGEMVPHIKVEEAIQQFVGMDEEAGPSVAVAAVPDSKKGERLVVLHTKIDKTPQEIVAHLKETGFPNLFIPALDGFAEIPEMPVLGTGKLDLKGLGQRATELFAANQDLTTGNGSSSGR